MARYVTTIASPLSAAEAFAWVGDVTRFAEWDPGVTRVVQVAGDGPGAFATYDLTVVAGGTSVMRYVVEAYDAPRRMRMVGRTALLTSIDEVTVEPTEHGSRVTYDAELTLVRPLGLFDPLLGVAFKRIGDRGAAGLRRVLRGTTVAR